MCTYYIHHGLPWQDGPHHDTYLGPTPKICYVPDKDQTFLASNPLLLDKDI